MRPFTFPARGRTARLHLRARNTCSRIAALPNPLASTSLERHRRNLNVEINPI